MSFSAKEAPEEMIDKRTPFSRAKSLAAYCRSSAFDQSDGPLLALEFEGLASAIADAIRANIAKLKDEARASTKDGGMMSHANITVRDEFDRFDRLWLEMEKLKVELKFVERQRDEAEKNLKSIFDRIETGESVYLQYDDGRTIYIVAEAARASTKEGNDGE